jgi:hypothetical protein
MAGWGGHSQAIALVLQGHGVVLAISGEPMAMTTICTVYHGSGYGRVLVHNYSCCMDSVLPRIRIGCACDMLGVAAHVSPHTVSARQPRLCSVMQIVQICSQSLHPRNSAYFACTRFALVHA